MAYMLDTTGLAFLKKKEIAIKEKKHKKEKKIKMENPEVKIKLLRKTSKIPVQKNPGDAGYDLYADIPDDIQIAGRSTLLIKTGICIEVPDGYAAFVVPRSGLSLKTPMRISNSPGTIDSGYRNEVGVIVDNIGDGIITIHPGDRIAQLVFIKVENVKFKQVSELSDSERGMGGFGSTGVK